MTEQILSAGVYAYENDQSFYTQGVEQTALAVVGPTEKGPAFVPTDVSSYSQYIAIFGADSANSYVPQTVYSYLQAGNTAKVTRVLGDGGFTYGLTRPIVALTSGSSILSVLYPTKNATAAVAIHTGSSVGGTYAAFNGKLWAYTGTGVFSSSFSASLDPTSPTFISKVLGTDENYQTGSVFPYLLFSNFITGSGVAISGSNYTGSIDALKFTTTACEFTSSNPGGYDHGSTPWVVADSGVDLFKFHHRSDGFKTNKDVKVCIANISQGLTATDYSTFDVIIRQWNDTDRSPSILEQFIGVSMDPDAANYIGKLIGDSYSAYSATLGRVVKYGDFENRSNYVRIEVADGVSGKAIHPQLYPNGHKAVYETIAGFASVNLPAAVMVSSTASSATFSGFDYSNSDNWNYLNPIPTGASTGLNAIFTKPAGDNKFVLPFQGGTDGMNFTTIKKKGADISVSNSFGFDLDGADANGTLSYVKALNILSNTEEYNFDILALPGVIEEYHPYVASVAENMCEDRTDAVYLRDLTGINSTVATAVATAASLDSSYSAAYYPWVKVKDLNTTKDIYVPPTVVVPQAYAYNDKVAAEWFAPAGLNRGGLGGAIDTRVRLTKADRDALYAGRVNPIAKFQTSGVVIWGQKTLQIRDTALNRINVRRLLINLREYISNVALNYVFENNTIATRNNLISAITPYMESVQTRQGLYAFRIQIDDTLNTNDVIDRNQLVGKIYVSPVKSIEFILLEFNITATGVNFG
jgi:hypothetical protein